MPSPLQRLAVALLDGGVRPDDPRHRDASCMRRMRTLNGGLFGLTALCPGTAAMFLAAGARAPALAVAIATLDALAIAAYVRRTGRIGRATHLSVINFQAVLLVLQLYLGGPHAPALAWLFVPALYAGLNLGFRASAGYAAVACLQIAAFTAADLAGVGFPDVLPGEDVALLVATCMRILFGAAAILLTWAFLAAQRSAEEALRDREARLRSVVDAIADGLVVFDSGGVIESVNRAACRIFGRTAGEMMGRSVAELIPADATLPWLDAPPIATQPRRERCALPGERVGLRGDGTRFPLEVCLADAEGVGQPRLIAVCRDLSERRRAEDALRAEERRYRLLADNITDVVFLTGFDGERYGITEYVSPSVTAVLGWKPEELIGGFARELLHPEDMATVRRDSSRVLRGERVPLVCRMRRREGSWTWVEMAMGPVTDERGKITHLQSTVRDITGRKGAEDALRAEERRYRLLADNITDIVVVTALGQDGVETIEYASPSVTRVLGWKPEELVGRSSHAFVHPDDVGSLAERASRLSQGERVTFTFRILHKDGGWLWVESVTGAIAGEQGGCQRFQSSVRDVTARREAEAETLKLAALVESVSDSVSLSALDGTLLYMNPAGRRMIGVGAEEISGVKALAFVPAGLRDELKRHVMPIVLAEGRWKGETQVEDIRTGERRDTILDIFWVREPKTARPLCLAAVTRDITERKQAERELQRLADEAVAARERIERQAADLAAQAHALAEARDEALRAAQAKSEFLANMSHEIRTPMNGVIGMAGLLLDTPLSEEQREFASTIRASADGLLTVINDILDFSKIEAGKLEIEEIDFCLRTVVEEVGDLLAPSAHRKGVELVCHVPPGFPEELRGDPGRIRQVVTNLVANAVKFTERGEVVVAARAVEETAGGVRTRIEVRDTGIGIPRERQAAVFESFTQVDGSASRRYGGTGLGLTICRQLVILMGGSVGLESEPGRGSRFWVELPLARVAAARRPRPPVGVASPDTVPAAFAGRSVLVADGNAAARGALREQLDAWGCRVEEAASGADLARCLDREAPAGGLDAILLDPRLAPCGSQADAVFARRAAGGAPVPLVLLHPIGNGAGVEPAVEAAAVASLTKPVHQTALLAALLGALGAAPRQERRGAPARRGPDPRLAGRRGLVAEDNPINQKVALRILERLGCRADAVGNGAEAVEALARVPYDVVLMDCQMPELDGYEATAVIRCRERQPGRHLPILAMTANAMEGDRERCLAAGMDDYVPKPVKPGELARALLRWRPAASGEGDPQPHLRASA